MHITCQFSLYPLGTQHLSPGIYKALAELDKASVKYTVGPMSTFVEGDAPVVLEALKHAFLAAAEDGPVVLTLTVSNACAV